MLADRHHVRRAHRAGSDLVDQTGDRRHVAVLEAHPHDARTALGHLDDPFAVLDRRAQRLLDQHVEIGHRQHVGQDVDVGHVGRDDHHGVEPAGIEHRSMVVEHARPASAHAAAPVLRDASSVSLMAVTRGAG